MRLVRSSTPKPTRTIRTGLSEAVLVSSELDAVPFLIFLAPLILYREITNILIAVYLPCKVLLWQRAFHARVWTREWQ